MKFKYIYMHVVRISFRTLNDLRHWELEDPLPVTANQLFNHLQWNHVLNFIESGAIWQTDASFIEIEHILKCIELIWRLVKQSFQFRYQELHYGFQSICKEVGHFQVPESFVPWNINVKTGQQWQSALRLRIC